MLYKDKVQAQKAAKEREMVAQQARMRVNKRPPRRQLQPRRKK